MKQEKRTVYISNDDVIFLDKEECIKYEITLKNLRYFQVNSCPDLTETGFYQRKELFCVYSENHHKEILIQYLIEREKGLIGTDVQGYGIRPKFAINAVTRKEFITFKGDKCVLSPIEISFNEKINYLYINYYEKWGLK